MSVGENPGWFLGKRQQILFLARPKLYIHHRPHIFIHLTSLPRISAFWQAHMHSLKPAPFLPFLSFFDSFHSHICFSTPVSSAHVLNINALDDTHTPCGSGLLHKHFQSREDSSDVCAQRAEAALSRIQRSVWTVEGFPWEDPRGARGDAAPLKHGWALIVCIWAVT